MSKENELNSQDIAESFVEDFYHDAEDEVQTEASEEDTSSVFDLYGNSRPLTPLESDTEGTACSDEADIPMYNARMVSPSNVTKAKNSDRNNQRLSTDTVVGASFLVERRPAKKSGEETKPRSASPGEPAIGGGAVELESEPSAEEVPQETVEEV